jgi:UDP-glucose-4-epimerase GalE
MIYDHSLKLVSPEKGITDAVALDQEPEGVTLEGQIEALRDRLATLAAVSSLNCVPTRTSSAPGDNRLNILVTGAAGYIGSVCAEVLIEKGLNVIGVDSLKEGNRDAVPSQAVFHEIDLGDGPALCKIFDQHRIDAVMHFAGEAVVEKSVRDPSPFYVTNVACGVVLLDAMVQHGVKKIIFSSTCAVYGEPEVIPIAEDHPKRPVNPYGKSKLVFEEILADYRKYTGLMPVSLRYFNVAGASRDRGEARREESHLIPRILHAVQTGVASVDVFGTDYPTKDGTCVRDYVHVLDIAYAHVRALECIDRAVGRAYNVGSGVGHSIMEVVETARTVTGGNIIAKFSQRRPGDPAVLVASKAKLRNELGWEVTYPGLTDIISSAWSWKQRHPNGYR